jgi:hypothetical protein
MLHDAVEPDEFAGAVHVGDCAAPPAENVPPLASDGHEDVH